MSGNGDVNPKPAPSRLDEGDKPPPFPPKPKGGYAYKIEYALERVITWEAIQQFHGKDNGNVKERDRDVAIATRNAVLYKCDVDRATGAIGFAPGWMLFQTGAQVDHLLKCFAWQLQDDGPGIELENMVIADETIKALKVLSAKYAADNPPVTKPKAKGRARSGS